MPAIDLPILPPMPTNKTLPSKSPSPVKSRRGEARVGRPPKEGEKNTVNKQILFTPSEWTKVNEALQAESVGEFSPFMKQLLLDWAGGDLLSENKAKERFETYEPIVTIAHDDLISVPLIDVSVACGAPMQGSDEVSHFIISKAVAWEIGYRAGDKFIRTRGQSMEKRGIYDEQLVLLSPLIAGKMPFLNDVALVAFFEEGKPPVGTLKTWNGLDGRGLPKLLDGNGDPFPLPPGTPKPLWTAKSVMGAI